MKWLYLSGVFLGALLICFFYLFYSLPDNNEISSSHETNILFITIDALRADHLGIYGYKRDTSPNIDKFFRNGIIYENAYSTEANTTPSVVSFLTGLHPQDTGIRLLYQKVPKKTMLISDYLSEEGYQTAGIVSNVVLCREATKLNLHFDFYDDFVDQKEPYRDIYERNAKDTTNAGIYWVEKDYKAGKPYFLWLHYQDPHGPYHPPSDKPKDFTHKHIKQIDINKVPRYQRG